MTRKLKKQIEATTAEHCILMATISPIEGPGWYDVLKFLHQSRLALIGAYGHLFQQEDIKRHMGPTVGVQTLRG